MEGKEAKRLLVLEDGRPTPQYQAYLKFAKLATEKEREMNEARQGASQDFTKMRNWPITGKIFGDELQQARNQWIALGYKNEIEQAISVLKATGDDTSFLKTE
ncbi:hypothetical protein GO755_05410 [Spirosoma sp. HMF4905]|uniref:Uncharacterized protein n=1 Tax=Spirosoma arboris TaxID=2682092 RepID=A0A7K1S6V2_9BACT|nr:hypothetical protein [Spirosoma arboris]MVM29460.1 hypothetical protein [Spirosoma arboris]